jgi:CheY-like chemotaxis protein
MRGTTATRSRGIHSSEPFEEADPVMCHLTQERIPGRIWRDSVVCRSSTVGGQSWNDTESLRANGDAGETLGKTRVLLADDNRTILARVRAVLGEDFDIVGAVTNGQDAVAEVWRLDPDVLLIDISMPILDGLQAVGRMGSNLRTKVVFLTVHEDRDFVDAAFAAGASGYVTKADVATELVPAILEVLKGKKYLSKSIDR